MTQGIDGNRSPLIALEPSFVSTIIRMVSIGQSLTLYQGLALINSVIEGTYAQDQLREFKVKYSYVNDDNAGSVSPGY